MRKKAPRAPDADTIKIDVKDFGPIRRGSIEIMPMTVLVGSNNSGKSYVSLLIRSMLGDNRVWRPRWTSRSKRAPVQKPIMNGDMSAKDHVDKATDEFIKDTKAEILRSMKRAFSDNLALLIRFGSDRCAIKTQTESITVRVNISEKNSTCKISAVQRPDIRLSNKNKKLRYTAGDESITVNLIDRGLADSALSDLIRRHFRPRMMFYFPAARSGILQGHEAISASIVRHAPYGDLEEIEIPKLPGAVADFIGDVIEMPTKRGPFYDIASNLEQEMLQGEIKIEHGHPASGIKYVYKQHTIPIHLASSTVSEMAPLVLYLKHAVSEKSTLIIEEPEAYLHPHNQAVLAKYLVRLVRRGIRIILTTHSPFVVEQISNMIQAGSIATAERANAKADLGKNGRLASLGLEHDDYLDAKEVAAYEFVPSGTSGYEIDRLDVEPDEGIPVEEFVNVTNRLYRQSLAIQDRVNGGP